MSGSSNSSAAESEPNDQPTSRKAIRVSFVATAKHVETKDCDARKIIEQVRSDVLLEKRIGRIRRKFSEVMASSKGDRKAAKKAVKKMKEALPAVLISGTFSERNDKALLQHSGLLTADLDALGPEKSVVRAKLCESKHLWAVFDSPTGDGLKAVFRVRASADSHLGSFAGVEEHVFQLTGQPIDKKCSNVGRLCFLSHDPDAYLNEAAEELPPLIKTEARKDSASSPGANWRLEARRKIATELLGDIDWKNDSSGHCTCPGQDQHTSGDGDQDCMVYLDQVSTVTCFHQSCGDIIAGVNHELRSRIGKTEFARSVSEDNAADCLTPPAWFNMKFPMLAKKFGDAVLIGGRKGVPPFVQDIAEDFMAATLSAEASPDTPTVFLPSEGRFYTYDPVEGIYVHQRLPSLLARLSRMLLECGEQCSDGVDTKNLKFRLRDSKKLTGVLKKAEHLLAVPSDFFSTDLTEFIACANGMLRLSDKALLPFSPSYYRRNKLAVAFDPEATCPLFLDTLMRPALEPDDLDLLQRWSGLALVGENLAQRFVILKGTAGGGKGTFVGVLTGIIGQENVGSLRTRLLGERFELSRFLGKTLLYGADVPEKFLNQGGAQVLKSLTGGDPMTLEFKRSNEAPLIICRFNALVTCNCRLTVRLEGDAAAWRRRLIIINYTKEPPTEIIADLNQKILQTEASGVLNWMLEGLDKLRADGWQLHLTLAQQQIVDELLLESESHNVFAKECLFEAPGFELTVEDCYNGYIRYCGNRGWNTKPRDKFSPLVADTIARTYRKTIRHDLKGGRYLAQRGWAGLGMVRDVQEP